MHMRLSFVHYPDMPLNFVSVRKSGFVVCERVEIRVADFSLTGSRYGKILSRNSLPDVILGMTWLSPNFAILDCNAKTVTLAKPGQIR